MTIRYTKKYDLAEDWMPLHPTFYEFVDKDEDGYFIKDKSGNRWRVVMIEE